MRSSSKEAPQADDIKNLPVPRPKAEYLEQASRGPENLTSAQRLLVILDLNGTLLYRPRRGDPTRFIPRPNVVPFLEYLFAHHCVMVWSSAKPHNVDALLSRLISPEQRERLVAVWARDTLGLDKQQYDNKVQVYKQLHQVWAQVTEQSGEAQDGRWGQHNTVLLDDSKLKASSEPFNLVEVPEFGKHNLQTEKNVLGQVREFLEVLKMQKDVSASNRVMAFKAAPEKSKGFAESGV